jgi:hypothetical protein
MYMRIRYSFPKMIGGAVTRSAARAAAPTPVEEKRPPTPPEEKKPPPPSDEEKKTVAIPEIEEEPEEDEEEAAPIDTKTYLKELADELHKPVRHKYPTRKVFARHMNETWAMDLADMSHWKNENDGYTYILMVIDVFTRWAAARPLKTKTGAEVLAAIKDVVEERKAKPEFIWCDEGKEFINKEITKWRDANNIGLYHTYGRGKAVIVERLNRTIKTMMWKKLTSVNSHHWVPLLPKLIEKYNSSTHGTMKMTPDEASSDPDAVDKVWKKKRKEQPLPSTPKYKVGDQVRVSRSKGVFEKGYDVGWSRETFIIASVNNTQYPTVYQLKDRHGEPIHGSFYEQELQKAKNADILLIERVIKERGKGAKKELYVKWLGYPESSNSWIKASATTAV